MVFLSSTNHIDGKKNVPPAPPTPTQNGQILNDAIQHEILGNFCFSLHDSPVIVYTLGVQMLQSQLPWEHVNWVQIFGGPTFKHFVYNHDFRDFCILADSCATASVQDLLVEPPGCPW